MLLALILQVAAAQPQTSQVWMVERQSTHRWMHASQRPEFTIPDESRAWAQVRIADGPEGRRSLTAEFLTAMGKLRGTADMDSTGRMLATTGLVVRDSSRKGPVGRAQWFDRGQGREFEDGTTVALPASLMWELAPVFRPRTLRAGIRWVDTLDLAAAQDGFRLQLSGVRSSEIVRDTLVDGRRLWWVRDSASVHIAERSLHTDYSRDSADVVDRVASGFIRGRYLYDVERRLAIGSWDTTRLSGTATLQYEDGRSFKTSARFERTRTIAFYDSAGAAQRRRAIEIAESRWPPAVEALMERMDKADSRLIDSLFAAWRMAPDAAHRDTLWMPLSLRAGNALMRRKLAALREIGDTAQYLRELHHRGWAEQLDLPALQFILPFLADPGRAFAFGRNAGEFFHNISTGMFGGVTWALQMPARTTDTTHWTCAPSACRLLAAQWPSAAEPRLRELGLLARFAMEPRVWTDSMTAAVLRGDPLAKAARGTLISLGVKLPGAIIVALPRPGSSWRSWLEWVFQTRTETDSSRRLPFDERIRLTGAQAAALETQRVIDQRDLEPELRSGFALPNDSAHLLFGALLEAIGRPSFDTTEIAQWLLLPRGTYRHDLAFSSMRRLFGASGGPSDTRTTAQLTDTLLAMVFDGAPPWAYPGRRSNEPTIHRLAEPGTPTLLDRGSTPIPVRWTSRYEVVQNADSIVGVRGGGRAIEFNVRATGSLAAVYAGFSQKGVAGGTTVYLLRTGTTWVIIAVESWIT